jgi:hypothetical protein
MHQHVRPRSASRRQARPRPPAPVTRPTWPSKEIRETGCAAQLQPRAHRPIPLTTRHDTPRYHRKGDGGIGRFGTQGAIRLNPLRPFSSG